LVLVVLLAVAGLVLDTGSTFAQRRTQQNAADLAALATANDLLLSGDQVHAQGVARAVARTNGFDPAIAAVTVAVTPYHPVGGLVTVTITAAHQNSFTPVVGIDSWTVGVSASAKAGVVTSVTGARPMIFGVQAFQTNGLPDPSYTLAACGPAGCAFGITNGDAPDSPGDLAWSNFGTGNVDSQQVSDIISGRTIPSVDPALNQYIGQMNHGWHNSLFDDVNTYLAGKDVLAAVTTQDQPDGTGGGFFQGWAVFHVVSAAGGSDKHIYGYFVDQAFVPGGDVEDCLANCARSFGAYTLKLTN
jgi:hypothetical protein